MYAAEEYLLLSGIQHFSFCRRQWALAYIEQQWQENRLTAEGHILHERAHESGAEKRGDTLIIRDMPVVSHTLGIRGACDVVEFHADPGGIVLHGNYGRKGIRYRPVPVEYKRGKPKEGAADLLQLCAQAICLEEMLVCDISQGYIFYGEPRRRLAVQLDAPLREEVAVLFREMHMLYARGHTPKVKPGNFCRACSLQDLCIPKLCKSQSVQAYIDKRVQEADA
ncbi:CRISPR-associated protein Cas4 [Christensenellaceae bacterium OttesenSCG-928-M15]|nr:CRISPR-associated protein Cas4 [Christensenellaceae bacterium OttesenSCG-928-M15]